MTGYGNNSNKKKPMLLHELAQLRQTLVNMLDRIGFPAEIAKSPDQRQQPPH